MLDTDQLVALNACSESLHERPLDGAANDDHLWLGYEAAFPSVWAVQPLFNNETQGSF